MKKLAQKTSSSRSIGEDWRQSLNKSDSIGHQTGCKKQTTVRFEEDTTNKLLRIQDSLEENTSFAETVRRTVSEGIHQIRNRQRFVLEALDYIEKDSKRQEVQEAVNLLKSEIEERKVNV